MACACVQDPGECVTVTVKREFQEEAGAIEDEAERGCDPDKVPTDCGNSLAIPFFLTYTIIGAFVLLNLVVAVILVICSWKIHREIY